VGRLQIFNNWSPYLVSDPAKIWIGAEYFCYRSDELWRKSDEEMGRLAIEELDRIEIINKEDVLDFTVARMPRTYPAYFGTYERFEEARRYLDGFENLFLVGRNGMHKYNNQDHSMLTAMTAVDNILAGRTDKENIWSINTEAEYHEEKK
jgi:protoporphyrinogen oxidase